MARKLRSVCLQMFALFLLVSHAKAEELTHPADADETVVEEAAAVEEDEAGWFQRLGLGIRVNPLGISIESDTGYQIPFYDSDSLLLDGSHIDFGLAAAVSPAYAFLGPFIEVIPVAFLKLRVSFQPLFYFGTFGFIYELEGLEADWSPDRLSQIADDGLGSSTMGWRLDTIARLQLKAGPVVIMAESEYVWFSVDAEQPYYEPFYDILMAPDEQVWLLTTVLGYVIGGELDDGFVLLGARWQRQTTKETEIKRQLLTALCIWDIPDAWWSWGDPKLAGIFGLYLEDPYVEHEPHFGTRLVLTF